jgi:glycerophosphoryl diester phosphodiesterase
VLIVHHDDTVDGTTPAIGEVRAMTYDEIAALDNAWWHVPGCWPCRDEAESAYVWRGMRTGDTAPPEGYTADDFRVATFTEIAERYPNHVLDIEIKIQRGDDGEQDTALGIEAATELARLVDELNRTDSVIVTSFNDDVIAAFRELAPDVVTSPGLAALSGWFLAGGELHPNDLILQVPPTYGDIEVMSEDLTARAHDEGYEVWVWPNGREEENIEFYDSMVAMGADGIIAGAPVAAARHWSGS